MPRPDHSLSATACTHALLLAATASLFLLVGTAAGQSDSVTIFPDADTTLFELNPDHNWGAEGELVSGTLGDMGGGARSRLLIRFDIAGSIPAGATIESASLRMELVRAPFGAVDSDFFLYRVLTPWEEGLQENGGAIPGGVEASDGETTWNNRFHNVAGGAWEQPGGKLEVDYAEDPSGDQFVRGEGTYLFPFNSEGIRDLRSMLANPASNYGWVLITEDESAQKTARRWTSREYEEEDCVPMLTIEFTAPQPDPEPADVTGLSYDEVTEDFRIDFQALAGRNYSLEWSPDMSIWTQVQSISSISDSEMTFVHPTGGATRGFYRILTEFPAP